MKDTHEALAIEGVRFFGEMCASISHEIKNVLAIINENAGLLQDMIAMQEKGIGFAPERLSRLAQSIARQVKRGDGIVRGMNRFAHSADDMLDQVNVEELIQFMIQLTGRLIDLKGQPPQIVPPKDTPTITTNRFFLENLVWSCLCRAMEACPGDRAVVIRIERSHGHAHIRFGGLDMAALKRINGFPSPRESAAAQLLSARLTTQEENREICIILPQRPTALA